MNGPLTIYALSSGFGRSGVSVVRVSGSSASLLLNNICTGGAPPPRVARATKLRDPITGEIIDIALVLFFPGPASVTGEDVAEFHVHGSPAVVAKLFEVFRRYANVVPAEPGAFTRKAYANGKLDLLEVEGLGDLLDAQSELQRKLALRQFLGEPSGVYLGWRTRLIEAAALAEAAIDFSDEADVAASALRQIEPKLAALRGELTAAVDLADRASAVRSGIRIVIGGPPNAGKSSLLNFLAGRDAAIVSPVAGTTRDVVEAAISFAGMQVLLQDTAGLRETPDAIELVGVERARKVAEQSDIYIWMTAADEDAGAVPARSPDMRVFNKIDLQPEKLIHIRNESDFRISLKSGEGTESFQAALRDLVGRQTSGLSHAVVNRDRHRTAVEKVIALVDGVMGQELPTEIVAEQLRDAAQVLSGITGHIGVEDYLDFIFSSFCIGK